MKQRAVARTERTWPDVLWAVLLLIVAAGGVLVGSVLAGHGEWAWLSVVLSVLGAGLLVVERSRQRRGRSSGELGSESSSGSTEQTQEIDALVSENASARQVREADAEPRAEETDPGDLEVISALDAQVLVVDERPRYHLQTCGWLGSRPTLPLAVREARGLGFTPCAQCAPDAELARRQRSAH